MNTNENANSNQNQANATEDETVVSIPTENQKLAEEAEKFKNEYLYLKAEFENYKRHAIKERAELLKFGAERFIRDLLGVLDNFERGLLMKVTPENYLSFVKGVEMTASELKTLLNKHSVTEVPSEGLAFDPNIHEALSAEPSESIPPGHVLRVFQKPYKFHDKILRPGQVVVAKKPEAN